MEENKTGLELIQQYFDEFTPQQLQQFAALGHLYAEWNGKINVISRKDIEQLYERHILHSLAIAAVAGFKPGAQVIDLGTGGGFPGIPLAIFFPETQFHLVDSINKKLTVVKEVAAAAGLRNVTTQHTRVEDIKGRQFDYVVSRAVAPLKSLWQWSRPFIRKSSGEAPGDLSNGLICLKGGDLAAEIADSGLKPRMWEIETLFQEPFFKDKYILAPNH
jgi:16S rRNA (guanine527-N7)-methyltransferase